MDNLGTTPFIRLEGYHGQVEPKFDLEITKQLDTFDKLGKCKEDTIYFNSSSISLGVICGFKVCMDFPLLNPPPAIQAHNFESLCCQVILHGTNDVPEFDNSDLWLITRTDLQLSPRKSISSRTD
jgi:hypothetical protein